MAYLLAKIFFLLILSALGGALLMYWWVRRRYEDITILFTELQSEKKSLANEIETLQRSLGLAKDLQHNLASMESKINSLPSALDNTLTPILGAVSNIRIPETKETNLEPVLEAIRNTHIPEAKGANLEPVLEAIHQIHIPEVKETDLNPILEAIYQIRIPAPKEADLSPVLGAINNIHIPEYSKTDLSPLVGRIDHLESKLDELLDSSKNSVQFVVEGSTNRLTQAVYGTPDDLKRIKGVGSKLESLLHGIGVYYFWQVAEWTPADITDIDALLDSFNGRIERDDWVEQAGGLAKTSPSSKG